MSIFGSVFETIKGAVSDPVCAAFKADPDFWQLVAALSGAKSSGAISNRAECANYAHSVQGTFIAQGFQKYVGCACAVVFPDEGSGGRSAIEEFAHQALQPRWTGWENLGGLPQGRVGVVSPTPETRELYIRWIDDRIRQRSWRLGGWEGNWNEHPDSMKIGSDPFVLATPTTRELFVTDHNGTVFQRRWDGSSWSEWLTVGGTVEGSVSAVRFSTGQINVYGRGMDDQIWENRAYDGSSWRGWSPVGGGYKIDAPPSVVSSSPTSYDIFVRAFGGAVYQQRILLGRLAHYKQISLGGEIKGEVGAVSLAPNNIELFVRGMDDALYQNWTYDGENWKGWVRHDDGGVIASAPAVIVPAIGPRGYPAKDVYVRDTHGNVAQKSWY